MSGPIARVISVMTGEPTPTPADGDTPVTESGPSAPVAPSGTPADAGESGGIRGFLDAHHDLSKMVREARRFSINLPLIGKVAVPQPKQLAFYGVLAGLAAAGAIEWPVAVTLGLGVAVTTRAQQNAAPPRQPALTAGPTVITAPSVVVVEAEAYPPAIIETDEPNVVATTDDSPAADEPSPRKTPQKRAPAKNTAAAAKKAPVKKAAAKKSAVKKSAAKKSAVKKVTAKKVAAKKAPAEKTPAEKAPAKKAGPDDATPE